MLFRRAGQHYGRTPQPETPYQRAGQLWDERIGSARTQARNWRYMAFGCLGLSTGLAAALAWEASQSRVVPYVVSVDKLGEPRALAPAETGYKPTDPQIAWHLARFVSDVRAVSLDPVVMRQNWLQAYDFATPRGALFLSDYVRSSNPFQAAGERAISVEVTSIVRASDRSFQVKWTETPFEHGVRGIASHWTGILTILIRPPTTTEVLRRNPLGLYVEAIDWSREIEDPPNRGPALSTPIPTASPTLFSREFRP